MRLGQLADPRQDNGIHEADADACNDTRADKHAGVLAAGHEGCAEDSKCSSNEDTPSAAYPIANPSYCGSSC